MFEKMSCYKRGCRRSFSIQGKILSRDRNFITGNIVKYAVFNYNQMFFEEESE